MREIQLRESEVCGLVIGLKADCLTEFVLCRIRPALRQTGQAKIEVRSCQGRISTNGLFEQADRLKQIILSERDAALEIETGRVMCVGLENGLHEGFRLGDLTDGQLQLCEGLARVVGVHVGNETDHFQLGIIPSAERDILLREHEPNLFLISTQLDRFPKLLAALISGSCRK